MSKTRKGGAKKKAAPSQSSRKAPKNSEPRSDLFPDSDSKFVNDLLIRHEAVERDADGKVPLNATHVIEKNKDGSVQVKRVRFKAF
jgi:hypothetical protein